MRALFCPFCLRVSWELDEFYWDCEEDCKKNDHILVCEECRVTIGKSRECREADITVWISPDGYIKPEKGHILATNYANFDKFALVEVYDVREDEKALYLVGLREKEDIRRTIRSLSILKERKISVLRKFDLLTIVIPFYKATAGYDKEFRYRDALFY